MLGTGWILLKIGTNCGQANLEGKKSSVQDMQSNAQFKICFVSRDKRRNTLFQDKNSYKSVAVAWSVESLPSNPAG